MKKNTLLFLFLMIGFISLGQEKINLVIFSEDGYAFYAFVNGVKQNSKAEPNVKVTGLSPNVSLRVEFEDKAKPQLKQNMALESGFEHTVRIKEDSKKQLKLRYFGQTALNDPSNAGATTVVYHSTEGSTSGGSDVDVASPNEGTSSQTNVSTTTTKTEVKTTTGDSPNDVAVNVNMAGVGISMNVAGMENMNGGTMNTTSSTTVTSTSSSSGYSNTDTRSEATSSGAAAPSSVGCSRAMSPNDFSKMKQSVEAKPFSETKMSTAKVATKNNCLTVNQIKEICKLFSMDEDKLAYAKYAYEYCTEKGTYYQVGDVFSFSSSTDELNAFLEK
jgi:hypothetical protein